MFQYLTLVVAHRRSEIRRSYERANIHVFVIVYGKTIKNLEYAILDMKDHPAITLAKSKRPSPRSSQCRSRTHIQRYMLTLTNSMFCYSLTPLDLR